MTEAVELRTRAVRGHRQGPHLLVTGGVHGDEFTPMKAARELVRAVTNDELVGTLTVVPIVNQAAFLRGSRTAEDGKDLARTCPGSLDGSVTEQIAAKLSRLIRAADYYIDLHTGSSSTAVYPMAGYTVHPRPEVLDKQRMMARAFNLPVIWGTTPTLDGRSLSVARDANVPAIYTEYLGSGVCDAGGVDAYVSGCLNVMASLGMIERSPAESTVRYIVEDTRPDSGHLQLQNPSPATGFFDSAIRLGDEINVGDRIGAVYGGDDDSIIEVESRQAGFVLALRTFSRVLQGESLAVILEV